MRSNRWIRWAVLVGCVLVALTVGVGAGWRSATVHPPEAPWVCRLIRPEVFDLLVPQRGPVQDDGPEKGPGHHSTACRAESVSDVDDIRASLWVALVRYGRRDGEGPQCTTVDGALVTADNRTNHNVALGDAAVYFLEGDPETGRVVHFTACLGTYLTYVVYEAVGVTDASIVESATTVAQEVLSQL